MKRVYITCGAYGYMKPGTQCVTPITDTSESIELPDAEADRLVSRGVARYAIDEIVCGSVATAVTDDYKSGTGVDLAGNGNSNTATPAPTERPIYNADSNVNVLRAIGKAVGISFKAGTTKVDMVQMLDKVYTDTPVGTGTDAEPKNNDITSTNDNTGDDGATDDEAPPTFGAEAPVI